MNMVALGEIMASGKASIDPRKTPAREFKLFSIPAFDAGAPELTSGAAIGSSKQVLRTGDVLLSKIIPHIRRVWVVDESSSYPMIGSSEWIVFRNEKFHPPYLRHILLSDPFHQAFMHTVAGVGGSLLRARPAQVGEIEIPLPSLTEQRRIAARLDAAESVLCKRRRSMALLHKLLDAMFLEWFGDPTVTSQFPVVSLAEICAAKGEYGANIPAVPATPGTPRYLRITDIRADGTLGDAAVAPGGSAAQWGSKLLRPGDIVFARSGATVGKTYLVKDDDEPMVFAGYLIRFSPDPQVARSEYVYQYTRTQSYAKWVANAATTVAQPNLNATKYATLELPLPPIALQDRFREAAMRVQMHARKLVDSQRSLSALLSALQGRAARGEA